MSRATTAPRLRPLTAPEEKAVALIARGIPPNAVAIQTGLSADLIATAVSMDEKWQQLRGESGRDQNPAPRDVNWDEALADTPGQGPASTSAPTAAEPLGLGELLDWAEGHDAGRVRTLAARARGAVAELRTLHGQDAARAAAADDVARLTADLAAAKARLREASPATRSYPGQRPAGARPDADRKAHLAAVREWAEANGEHVAPLGRIPNRIEAAYAAAMRGAS